MWRSSKRNAIWELYVGPASCRSRLGKRGRDNLPERPKGAAKLSRPLSPRQDAGPALSHRNFHSFNCPPVGVDQPPLILGREKRDGDNLSERPKGAAHKLSPSPFSDSKFGEASIQLAAVTAADYGVPESAVGVDQHVPHEKRCWRSTSLRRNQKSRGLPETPKWQPSHRCRCSNRCGRTTHRIDSERSGWCRWCCWQTAIAREKPSSDPAAGPGPST